MNYSNIAHTQAKPVGVSITSQSPNQRTAGNSIVIVGTSFGGSPGSQQGSPSNGSLAQVSNWTATPITTIVPQNATSGLIVEASNHRLIGGLNEFPKLR